MKTPTNYVFNPNKDDIVVEKYEEIFYALKADNDEYFLFDIYSENDLNNVELVIDNKPIKYVNFRSKYLYNDMLLSEQLKKIAINKLFIYQETCFIDSHQIYGLSGIKKIIEFSPKLSYSILNDLKDNYYSLPTLFRNDIDGTIFNLSQKNYQYLYANVIYYLNYDIDDELYFLDDYDGTIIDYLPSVPTRDGYLFTGWYTNRECTTIWNESTVINKEIQLNESGDYIYTYHPTILYAGWKDM